MDNVNRKTSELVRGCYGFCSLVKLKTKKSKVRFRHLAAVISFSASYGFSRKLSVM